MGIFGRNKDGVKALVGLVLGLAMVLVIVDTVAAQPAFNTRKGFAAIGGHTFNLVDNAHYAQWAYLQAFDPPAIGSLRFPKWLHYQWELHAGAVHHDKWRAMISGNVMAQYAFDGLGGHRFRPYAEFGMGIIYTDFQIRGQGLRFNFNPQAGIGSDVHINASCQGFIRLRWHHLSNASLHDDNTSVDSVLLMIGKYF